MSDHQLLDGGDFLSRLESADDILDGVLNMITKLALQALPDAGDVSLTLLRGDGPYTGASTGTLASQCDECQYELGHGPCPEAIATAATVSVPDLSREQRWPGYARHALVAGARSSLSIALSDHAPAVGALNVYARKRDAFDDNAIVLAQTFAAYAAVALANVRLYNTQVAVAQQMQAMMNSRVVIEQAKGVIMGKRGCNADDAFAALVEMSRATNRRLGDVAAALVGGANE